jgi:hypothetical protein
VTSYPVGDRVGQLIVGIGFTAVGGLFAVGGALVALGIVGSDGGAGQRVGALVGCLVGGFCAVVGWGQGWRMPYALRVGNDGVLYVLRPLRTTRVPIGTIRAIDKVAAKVGVEEADARELRIRHAGGTIPVAYFDGVERFIADVRARNPRIAVPDGW